MCKGKFTDMYTLLNKTQTHVCRSLVDCRWLPAVVTVSLQKAIPRNVDMTSLLNRQPCHHSSFSSYRLRFFIWLRTVIYGRALVPSVKYVVPLFYIWPRMVCLTFFLIERSFVYSWELSYKKAWWWYVCACHTDFSLGRQLRKPCTVPMGNRLGQAPSVRG